MADNPATRFGTYLRAAREARGVSLRQIAAATRISFPVLDALERNDISRLPGGLFSRAFVRAYAKEVGLDPDRTIEVFLAQFPEAAGDAIAERAETEALAEPNRRSRLTLGFIGVGVLVVLAAGWMVARRFVPRLHQATPVQIVEPVAGGRQQVPPPVAAPHEATAPPQQDPAPAPPNEPRAGEPAAAAGQLPTPTQAVVTAPVVPAAAGVAAASVATATATPGLRMTLTATAPCWVRASLDEARAFERTLQAGEHADLQAENSIVLKVGNAGALTFTLNGMAGRSLGVHGHVVTERIDRTNLESYVLR
jgi:cytoskeleton protein RodZ